jgi:cation diffusion facilitator CzcD-associated flavoprotein CzcO
VVVVIGAGPAGLAAAAMLQGAGQQVVVLERLDVGALWASRYDRLHLHTVRWLSGLPGLPIPRSAGRWASRDRVVDYLHAYAAYHRLEIRSGVAVSKIDAADGGWVAQTSDGEHRADRVVVAAGYNNVAFVPDWPGELGRELVHSAHYRNGEPFRGGRVLVVGAGNSGAEIAVDLVEHGAAAVTLSVRTPPAIVRRDVLGLPSQVFGVASGHLPVAAVDAIAATIRRVAIPNLEPYGLPAPARPYTDFLRRSNLPILDVGIVEAVRTGRVRVVPALAAFEPGRALFADGSREELDAVVAATGFRPGLGELVGDLGVLDQNGVPLVHGAEEHPEAPRLHFIGYRVVLGGTFRQVGIEARQLAQAIGPGPGGRRAR